MSNSYNTDPHLWADFFRKNPEANMRYLDGAVYVVDRPESGCVALFENNQDAIRCMTIARDLAKK